MELVSMEVVAAFILVMMSICVRGFPSPESRGSYPIYTRKTIQDTYDDISIELLQQPQAIRVMFDMLAQVALQQQTKLEFMERSQLSLRNEMADLSMDNTYLKKFVIEQLTQHHSESAFKPHNDLGKTSNMFLPWDNYFKTRTKLKVDDVIAMNDSLVGLDLRVSMLNKQIEGVEAMTLDIKRNTVDHFASIINNILPELEQRVEERYYWEREVEKTKANSSLSHEPVMDQQPSLSLCEQCSAQGFPRAPRKDNSTQSIWATNITAFETLAVQYRDTPRDIKKLRQSFLVKKVTGSRRLVLGAWMQDGYLWSPKIWMMQGYRNLSTLIEYKDNQTFMADSPLTTYKLPFICGGTGHIVYNNSVYCPAFKSNKVCKYNLQTGVVNETRLPGKGVRNYEYSVKGFNSIDLLTDSQGIWVIYSNKQAAGKIVVLKLDPVTLQRVFVSRTRVDQSSVMNCFMIFGNLFAVQRPDGREFVEIRKIWSIHELDEESAKGRRQKITIKNSRYMVSADFNPEHLRLYTWNWESLTSASLRWYEFDLM